MPTQISEVVRHLRRAVLRQEEDGLTDGQLLGRFIEQRGEAAVAALVRRHGPMVWGTVRRILPNHHDAEDAFQATFLVLLRRAASITPREMVGNWLYGVAHQTARKARALLAKRQARERQVTALPEAQAPEQGAGCDLGPVLDQELNRLPEKYRVAIVLCDLAGKTRREVARQLGLPEGTLAGRLTRGRALLAKRLARRGLALSGGALAGVLSRQAVSASVPTSVMDPAIQAVTAVAAGRAVAGAASGTVAALTEGVLKAMWMTRAKKALGACLVGALLLSGAFGYRSRAGDKPPPAPAGKKTAADKAHAAPSDGKLRDTLLVLDKQFWEAASNYDVDTLDKLLADDYIVFSPDGHHWNKKFALERYRQGRFINVKFPSKRIVTRINEHTAILSYEVIWGAEDKGTGARPDVGHDRMISCWVQRDGGWFLRYTECVNRVNFPDRRPVLRPPATTRFHLSPLEAPNR
jgi:RNA polymerase sigma factor (sigma-70 family)